MLAVGPEARACDDEAFDPEVGEAPQSFGTHVRRAHDGEAVDELGRERRCVLGRVAQMFVAVVAAPDFRDDFTVGFGQPRAGGSGAVCAAVLRRCSLLS